MHPVVILLARAAIAAPAHAEMRSLAEAVGREMPGWTVMWAFSEQAQPSLRSCLDAAVEAEARVVRIVSLTLPTEPSAINAISRTVQRWAKSQSGPAPRIEIAPPLTVAMPSPAKTVAAVLAMEPVREIAVRPLASDASQVPEHRSRVLLCSGGACMNAGADELWQQLRYRQEAEQLRSRPPGMMSCRTTCLGPCALGPVLQVWPDGTYYGGVSLAALDEIIDTHMLGGRPVERYAYLPGGAKQSLRDG